MKLDIAVTAPLMALVLIGAGLVAAGWVIASTWQLVWLKRLRVRNLRIVADLRRLTSWEPPSIRREAGNWRGEPWPASGRHRVPDRGAARSGHRPQAQRHQRPATTTQGSRAVVAGPPEQPAHEPWSRTTTIRSSGAPEARARAHIPERAVPIRSRARALSRWLVTTGLLSTMVTARMAHWANYVGLRLWPGPRARGALAWRLASQVPVPLAAGLPPPAMPVQIPGPTIPIRLPTSSSPPIPTPATRNPGRQPANRAGVRG